MPRIRSKLGRRPMEFNEAHYKREMEFWRIAQKSDGFDIDHLKKPHYGFRVFMCKPDENYSVVVHLYAMMGLHLCSSVQGTNLQLHHIVKYNRSLRVIPAYYYITLRAVDPSISRRPVTFQTRIDEISCNEFNVQCNLVRPKREASKIKPNMDAIRKLRLFSKPKCWPSDEDLTDKDRFYLVQESDLKENDWIRLYMELSFVTTNRHIHDHQHDLSDLEIVEVVVETSNKRIEKLNGAFDAFIYIEYKQDLGKDQFLIYRTKIRRTVDVINGILHLVGDNQKIALVGDSQEPSHVCEARVHAVHKAEKLMSCLEPVFPSFVKPMPESHITAGLWLVLERQFCMTHLPLCDEMLTLIDEDGREFPTEYIAKDNALIARWRCFTTYHKLIVGDVVVFRLINQLTFKVYIIRVCDEANNDSDINCKESISESSKRGGRK